MQFEVSPTDVTYKAIWGSKAKKGDTQNVTSKCKCNPFHNYFPNMLSRPMSFKWHGFGSNMLTGLNYGPRCFQHRTFAVSAKIPCTYPVEHCRCCVVLCARFIPTIYHEWPNERDWTWSCPPDHQWRPALAKVQRSETELGGPAGWVYTQNKHAESGVERAFQAQCSGY